MTAVIVILAIVAVVVVVGWMVFNRKTPEKAAMHERLDAREDRRETDDFAKGVDRPADPGAEDQRPLPGDAAPGPPGPPG